jgi:L-ribulose-5-phosphate 3-epimerase
MKPWGDRFGINTYAYTQSKRAVDCVHMLAERGVKTLELMFFPGHLWVTDSKESLSNLRREIEASGIALVSLNSPNIDLNIAAGTEEMRRYTLDLNRRYLQIAAELGAEGLILGPGKSNPLFPLPRSVLETHFFNALDELLPLSEQLGVELWAENMPFAFLPDIESLLGSLDRYGNPAIKVCYDVANAYFIGEDPVAGISRIGERLRLIHLSDTTRSIYRHDPVGAGDMDFARILPAVEAAGLTRAPVLEIISKDGDRDIAQSIERLAAIAA